MNIVKDNVKKILTASAISNGLLMISLIIIVIYNFLFVDLNGYIKLSYIKIGFIFLIIFSIVSINLYLTVKSLSSSMFTSDKDDEFKETIDSLSNLNKTLRAQRHDFINHLQIIYNLMELEEYKESKDYIEKIYEDVIRVNKALKTKSAAVNAILQAKTMYAEKRNIKVNLYVNTSLEKLPLPDWQLCRIIGNIIDNAIYELVKKKENGILTIELVEDVKSYKVSISNNGSKIEKEIIRKIFKEGFSTKGKDGTGMGLSITEEIINEYKGSISVKSTNLETKFEIVMPKAH